MAENSHIGWTDDTHNHWIGCQKVSPGCDHCYAEALMDTRYKKVEWGPHGARRLTSEANRKKPYTWNRKAAAANTMRRVFCSSLADILDNHKSIEQWWRDELFEMMENTPNLIWLCLTKRPENAEKFMPPQWFEGRWPFNVWVGTSTEDAKTYNHRWPHLRKIPAPVRFISHEPALGSISEAITEQVKAAYFAGEADGFAPDWIITGGESGHGARPYNIAWAAELVQMGAACSIPIFVKQLGSKPIREIWKGLDRKEMPYYAGKGKREDPADWPEGIRVQHFPRAADIAMTVGQERMQGITPHAYLAEDPGGNT